MFNFNKKMEDDPQKALDNAKNTLNSGLTGGLAKMFMGRDFVDKMNNGMDQAQSAIDGVNQNNWLAQSGLDADALVLSVTDTGMTINMNPVVELRLKINSAAGISFEAISRTMVSRISVPRAGDSIKIKYNPADPTQIFVL